MKYNCNLFFIKFGKNQRSNRFDKFICFTLQFNLFIIILLFKKPFKKSLIILILKAVLQKRSQRPTKQDKIVSSSIDL